MFNQLSFEQQAYILQFVHHEKVIGDYPGVNDTALAALLGIDASLYQRIKAHFAANARGAAEELLADTAFAAKVDALPFKAGETIIGLGDSITDDWQSWLEILRHLVALRRPKDNLNIVNAGISGHTTADMNARFLAIVAQQPKWILCMAGTNDARGHGLRPTKPMISLEETAKNLVMLRAFAANQTTAQWIWITPATVIQDKISTHWFIGQLQVTWSNDHLAGIGSAMRQMADPVVDLQPIFGIPANPDFLLDDGLHPSLAGQKAIVRAVVEKLSGG
jgi:lysophospholipase L1-like esterase